MENQKLNTNKILKRVLSNVAKYEKDSFINKILFNIDIEHCNPIDFTATKYKKKLHENNFFLFISNDYKIIGILYGNTFSERYKDFINWYDKHCKMCIQNRLHLNEQASYILMITPGMRTKKLEKVAVKPKKLKERLYEYKKNKYDNVSEETMHEKIKEIFIKLSTNFYNDKYINEIGNVLAKRNIVYYSYCKNSASIIKEFATCAEEYDRSKNYFGDKKHEEIKQEILKWYDVIK